MTRSGAHNGQTFGKQALGVRVVRDNGKPVGVRTVLLREFLFRDTSDNFIFIILPLFDVLVAARRLTVPRTLHDKAAHTHVVSNRRGGGAVVVGVIVGVAVIGGVLLAIALPSFIHQTQRSRNSSWRKTHKLPRSWTRKHSPGRRLRPRPPVTRHPDTYATGAVLAAQIEAAIPALAGHVSLAATSTTVGEIAVGDSTPTEFFAIGIDPPTATSRKCESRRRSGAAAANSAPAPQTTTTPATTAPPVTSPTSTAPTSNVVYEGKTSPNSATVNPPSSSNTSSAANRSAQIYFDLRKRAGITWVTNFTAQTYERCPGGIGVLPNDMDYGFSEAPMVVKDGHFSGDVGSGWYVAGDIADGHASGTVRLGVETYGASGGGTPVLCTGGLTGVQLRANENPQREPS